jgi:hypothetical protein
MLNLIKRNGTKNEMTKQQHPFKPLNGCQNQHKSKARVAKVIPVFSRMLIIQTSSMARVN